MNTDQLIVKIRCHVVEKGVYYVKLEEDWGCGPIVKKWRANEWLGFNAVLNNFLII